MTIQETTAMLSMLGSVWPHVPIDQAKIGIYHAALRHVAADDAADAALRWIATGKYFPVPAELLELVAERAAPQLSGGDAWAEVIRFVRRYGHDSGRDRLHELPSAVAEAVRAVGWRRICLDDNDRGYVTRDFEAAYLSAAKRTKADVQIGAGNDAVLAVLPGSRS